MAKVIIASILGVFVLFAGSQIVSFWDRRGDLKEEYEATRDILDRAEQKRDSLAEELEYLSRPENLEKELRARFNFHAPGEKTLILVPRSDEATTTEE